LEFALTLALSPGERGSDLDCVELRLTYRMRLALAFILQHRMGGGDIQNETQGHVGCQIERLIPWRATSHPLLGERAG
jgi:hypothetical protein